MQHAPTDGDISKEMWTKNISADNDLMRLGRILTAAKTHKLLICTVTAVSIVAWIANRPMKAPVTDDGDDILARLESESWDNRSSTVWSESGMISE